MLETVNFTGYQLKRKTLPQQRMTINYLLLPIIIIGNYSNKKSTLNVKNSNT